MSDSKETRSALWHPSLMGIHNWSVSDNKIWADANFAALFSIETQDLAEGIPVERFLECIADEDRPRIAYAVHHAITTGEAYNESYQIIAPGGSLRPVVAFGRCLRNEDGIPLFFAGAAMAGDADLPLANESSLEAHCRAALQLAKQAEKQIAVRYLEAALFALK